MAQLKKNRRPATAPPSFLDELEAAEADNRRLRKALADAESAALDRDQWINARIRGFEAEIARLENYVADLEAEVMSPGVWTVA
jgi:hypothetical protein